MTIVLQVAFNPMYFYFDSAKNKPFIYSQMLDIYNEFGCLDSSTSKLKYNLLIFYIRCAWSSVKNDWKHVIVWKLIPTNLNRSLVHIEVCHSLMTGWHGFFFRLSPQSLMRCPCLYRVSAEVIIKSRELFIYTHGQVHKNAET